MKRAAFIFLIVFFSGLIHVMGASNDTECECDDLAPSFTFQEIGGCMVEFSSSFNEGSCHDDVAFGWDFDDGTSAQGQNVTHTFPGTGNYVVRLVVTSSTEEGPCTQNVEQVVQVQCGPSGNCDCQDFSPEINLVNTSACGVDLLAVYGGEACVGGVKYIWNMGDGTQLLGREVSHTYSESGTYTIELTVYPGENGTVYEECVETIELVVEVDCNSAGECNCETLSALIQIEDLSDCEVDLMGLYEGDPCLEENITYAWNFGDNTNATGQNVSHEYSASGAYTVRLDVTASDGQNTCTKTVTQEVEVTCESAPCECTLEPEIEIINIDECSVTFRGISGGDPCLNDVKYLWDFGDGTEEVGEEVTHQFDGSGTYTVTFTVSFSNSEMSCMERTKRAVEVSCGGCDCEPITDANIVLGRRSGCSVGVSGIVNSSCHRNMLFRWFINGDEVATGQSTTLNFPGSGSYGLVLAIYGLDENGEPCSKNKIELPIEIDCDSGPCNCDRLAPVVQINSVAGCEFEFIATQSIECFDEVSFHWDFGDGTSANFANVSHEYSQPGTYTVTLNVVARSGNKECKQEFIKEVGASCAENIGRNNTIDLKDLTQFEFSSYPNPSSGLINLEFPESDEETLVNVYSITGQQVYEKTISRTSTVELDLAHLSKGVYIIKLVQGANTAVKHVVIK